MITEAEEATEGTFIASVNAEHEEEVAGGYFETTRLRTACKPAVSAQANRLPSK
jgi:hypothetical protein